jgi:hypothetical protein
MNKGERGKRVPGYTKSLSVFASALCVSFSFRRETAKVKVSKCPKTLLSLEINSFRIIKKLTEFQF